MLTGKNDTILNSLSKMVQLSLPKCGRNVFGISGNEELDAVFNGFKSTVLQSLYVLFKYVRSRSEKNEGKGGEGWKPQETIKVLRQTLVLVIESTYSIYKMESFAVDAILKIEALKDVISQSFKLLANMTDLVDFYAIYNETAKNLLVHLILPNLLFQEYDRDLYDHNEIEFAEYSFDLCYEQKSKTIKSYSMQLLENLCDKIDFFFTYCAQMVFGTIDSIAKQLPQDEAEVRFPTLLDLKDTGVDQLNLSNILDVCLLICSAVSFMVVIREQIL